MAGRRGGALLLSTLLVAVSWLAPSVPARADTTVRCASGFCVEVRSSFGPVGDARAGRAMCIAVAGATALGEVVSLPNPLPLIVVDDLGGQRLNAAFIHPGWLDATPDHFVVTADLLAAFDDDALAFVMAHETAHQVHGDNVHIRWLMLARGAIAYLVVVGLVFLRFRYPPSSGRRTRITVSYLVVVAGLSGATFLLSTIAIAAFNTRIEYSADQAALQFFLTARGWSRARALVAFKSFLNESPEHEAGSWLQVNRHPSDADRRTAVTAFNVRQ